MPTRIRAHPWSFQGKAISRFLSEQLNEGLAEQWPHVETQGVGEAHWGNHRASPRGVETQAWNLGWGPDDQNMGDPKAHMQTGKDH